MAREIVKSHSSSSIGSVKQSMLDEATFQSIHGTGWVLMDGRDVTGSDYDTIVFGGIGGNIPDARGQFLRGLDTSGVVDPDGAGRVIGDSQVDDFKEHDHTIRYVATYDLRATGGTDMYGTNISSFNKDNPETDLRGGAETRPKNVAVNMFIKINREPSS